MDSSESLKIAIISSPRSGNSWLRKNLANLLNLKEYGAHHPKDLPKELPKRCIIQIHWPPDEDMTTYIKKNKINPIITISRHPLDTLLSMLRFVQFEPETLLWLGGEAQVDKLKGLKPTDKDFLKYCKSDSASKALDVSYSWRKIGGDKVISVKYEAMIRSKYSTLKSICKSLNTKVTSKDILISLRSTNTKQFEKIKKDHVWTGDSGRWVDYFTPESSKEIYNTQKRFFEYADYSIKSARLYNTKQMIDKLWLKESMIAEPPICMNRKKEV